MREVPLPIERLEHNTRVIGQAAYHAVVDF